MRRSPPPAPPRRVSRRQAIADLHAELVRCVDDQSSLCRVAGRQGFFCGGFAGMSRSEKARRFPWIPPEVLDDPEAFERRAESDLLPLQDVSRGRLPCDVDGELRVQPCAGWEEFYECELARFHRELCGENVEVVPDELVETG